MNVWLRLYVFTATSLGLMAQPAIYPRGVVNAASYTPAGLPGGGIARGSIFTIFGARLGPTQGVQVSAFPIAQTLSSVSIQATQGATSVAVLPLYVSAGQINALMPSNTPLGLVSLRVTYNNQPSNPSTVRVVNSSFGFFSISGSGVGPGALLNFVADNNQPLNSPLVTAMPGQVITAYGTGLGPVSADNVPPVPGSLPTPVEVTVGGQVAPVLYSGRSPCCAGLDQIVFRVPPNVTAGCFVPVYLRTEAAVTSGAVTMAVDPVGAACPTTPLTSTLLNGGKAGILYLVRTAVRQDTGVASTTDTTSDALVFDLAQHKGGSFDFYPPAGSCTVYQRPGDWLGTGSLSAGAPLLKLLDAGAFSVTGPKGNKTALPPVTGAQAAFLGAFWSAPGFPNQLYLDQGSYQVSAAGGADVGQFQASATVPPPFTWTNRDQLSAINRTQPLTVSWSGAGDQTLAIIGAATDLPTNSSTVFVCVAASGAGSLTVPPAILSALPATRATLYQSKAALYLTNVPFSSAVPFTAPGLDAAIATSVYSTGRTVTVK